MQQTPQNIPNEVVRGYSGRFLARKVELERLVDDMRSQLSRNEKDGTVKITFLVGLKNGIVYETEDIGILFQEENAQSLKIVLLVISGVLLKVSEKVERKIIVYFSRGRTNKMNRSWDYVEMSNGYKFDISSNGMGYLVTESNRKSALAVIENIEERLQKFRPVYSSVPEFNLSFSKLLLNSLGFMLFGITIYFLIWFGWTYLPGFPVGSFWDQFSVYPKFTQPLISVIVVVYLIGFLGAVLNYLAGRLIMWFIPPSAIEIGDEAEKNKTQNNIRQAVFWTIIIGGLVGVAVNLITK